MRKVKEVRKSPTIWKRTYINILVYIYIVVILFFSLHDSVLWMPHKKFLCCKMLQVNEVLGSCWLHCRWQR